MAVDSFGTDEFFSRILNASEQCRTKALVRQYTNLTVSESPYTVLYTDSILGCNTSTGAITINLINANDTDTGAGFVLTVKDESGNSSSNNITINAASGEQIEGNNSALININNTSLTIYSNGVSWFID